MKVYVVLVNNRLFDVYKNKEALIKIFGTSCDYNETSTGDIHIKYPVTHSNTTRRLFADTEIVAYQIEVTE